MKTLKKEDFDMEFARLLMGFLVNVKVVGTSVVIEIPFIDSENTKWLMEKIAKRAKRVSD